MATQFEFPHPAVAASYLMAASPDAVFEWMAGAANAKKDRPFYEANFDQQLILQLLSRGEPLIDLAVASFCDDGEALGSLWKSGDRSIRLAIAGNVYRRGFAGLQNVNLAELCDGDDTDMRRLVFGNPSMAHAGLANFLDRKEAFAGLTDIAWRKCLHVAIRNPILRSPPKEDRFSDDGWSEYEQGRPFTAVWRLLLVLENSDENAHILSDAYLNIADFSPPYDDPLMGKQFARPAPDAGRESMEDSSRRNERGTRAFIEAMLRKWGDPPTTANESERDDRWPTTRGFIRQGIAAAASRRSYHKDLILFLRDHPDKWVRAGFYAGFPFRDAGGVEASYTKEPVFFVEQAVYNDALYLNTAAGRAYRGIVGARSGSEWEHFSDDQMRRSVFHHRALDLWKKNPTLYPHPDDDTDAGSSELPKRERDEALADYLWRRSDELKTRTNARLDEIRRWLAETPGEPHRVLPLIALMIAGLQREMEERTTLLASEPTAKPSGGLGSLFGDRRR